MKKKQWECLVLVVLIAGSIFYFSAQPALDSSKTSGVIVDFIIEHFYPDYDQLSVTDQEALQTEVQNIVRKSAHFLIYAALGFSLGLLINSFERTISVWWAQLVGSLYAVSDEIHQIFVEGRAGMWQDVLLDSAGVLAGILIVCLIHKLIPKKKVENE